MPQMLPKLSVWKRFRTCMYRSAKLFTNNRDAKSLRNWQAYLRPYPVGGYVGYLGYHNLGDEIMFLAFQKLFPGCT